MKRKRLILVSLAIVLSGAAAYYRFVPGRAPAGQQPLANMETAAFERQFQAGAAETRVLVMASPT